MAFRGLFRVSAAIPPCHICNPEANAEEIISLWKSADEAGSELIVFPELCITSYTCRDLFLNETLLHSAEEALSRIISASSNFHAMGIVGTPLTTCHGVYNVAVVIRGGQPLCVVPKSYLPNYREFEECRWFRPGTEVPAGARIAIKRTDGSGPDFDVPFGRDIIVMGTGELHDVGICVEICEDTWVQSPPSARLVGGGANIVANLSASNFVCGKAETRRLLARASSCRSMGAYMYVASGPGESTTDLAFDSDAFVCENGAVIAESERFCRRPQLVTTDVDITKIMHERHVSNTFPDCAFHVGAMSDIRYVHVDGLRWAPGPTVRPFERHPFVPREEERLTQLAWEVFHVQSNGLASRFAAVPSARKLVLGISGGLDSTQAALVAAFTLDLLHRPRSDLVCVTMPGLGTSSATKTNALDVAKGLGAEFRTISISEASRTVLQAMGHPCAAGTSTVEELIARLREDPSLGDASLENVQARMRTLLLMCIANREAGIVVGTGDLSEKALGWCTYSGDHIAMYDVNCGIPKTLITSVIRWVATRMVERWGEKGDPELLRKALFGILNTPISPELLPTDAQGAIAQLTEKTIGPYELHDFFLFHLISAGRSPKMILDLARAAFGESYSLDDLKKYLTVFIKRFFANQFKRSCATDGPKVLCVALSPRGDWRMPSDASCRPWLKEIEDYKPLW